MQTPATPGLPVLPHGPGDVVGIAEAVVRIDDEGRRYGGGGAAGGLDALGHRNEADVGKGELRRRKPEPAQPDGREPRLRQQAGAEGIVRAANSHQPPLVEPNPSIHSRPVHIRLPLPVALSFAAAAPTAQLPQTARWL